MSVFLPKETVQVSYRNFSLTEACKTDGIGDLEE